MMHENLNVEKYVELIKKGELSITEVKENPSLKVWAQTDFTPWIYFPKLPLKQACSDNGRPINIKIMHALAINMFQKLELLSDMKELGMLSKIPTIDQFKKIITINNELILKWICHVSAMQGEYAPYFMDYDNYLKELNSKNWLSSSIYEEFIEKNQSFSSLFKVDPKSLYEIFKENKYPIMRKKKKNYFILTFHVIIKEKNYLNSSLEIPLSQRLFVPKNDEKIENEEFCILFSNIIHAIEDYYRRKSNFSITFKTIRIENNEKPIICSSFKK